MDKEKEDDNIVQEEKEEESNVVSIATKETLDYKKVSAELERIEDCREALARAKSETLTNVIIVGRTLDGRLYIENNNDLIQNFVYMLETAKLRIMGV